MEVTFPDMGFATRLTSKEIDHPRDVKEFHSDSHLDTNKYIINNKYHSNDKLESTNRTTEYLDFTRIIIDDFKKYSINNKDQPETKNEEICSEINFHSNTYRKQGRFSRSIVLNEFGMERKAADCKYKHERVGRQWTEAKRRTLTVQLHVLTVVCLCLALLAPCAAAPAHSRSRRGTHAAHKDAVSLF